jgi:uncharacterized membrane protein
MKSAMESFPATQKEQIKQAIVQAELATSGEIRVHIENTCSDVMNRAAFIFKQLNMHKTELRNGVLIYLAIRSHKFAIIGDAGINAKVPENFWNQTKEEMLSHFVKEEFTEGLCHGIALAGESLKKYFPRSSEDKNELNDEISFDNH